MSSNWSECHQTATDIAMTDCPQPDTSSEWTALSRYANREQTDSQEVSSNACALYWNHLTKSFEDDFFVVSLYNHVESIIQTGPKCGLVALLMCQPLVADCETTALELNQNDLFETGKQMGFTKTGEMFSVDNMAKLAERVLSVRTEVRDKLKERRSQLVCHLARGLPALVPYDSDANHEPTLLAGERAHWAVIIGFCMAIKTERLSEESVGGVRDERNPQLIHLKPNHSLADCVRDVIDDNSYERLWVYARQGKSKHLHIWDFERLCDSNCNLVKTSRKLNPSDIVLPENGGIIQGLNDKFLFINGI